MYFSSLSLELTSLIALSAFWKWYPLCTVFYKQYMDKYYLKIVLVYIDFSNLRLSSIVDEMLHLKCLSFPPVDFIDEQLVWIFYDFHGCPGTHDAQKL